MAGRRPRRSDRPALEALGRTRCDPATCRRARFLATRSRDRLPGGLDTCGLPRRSAGRVQIVGKPTPRPTCCAGRHGSKPSSAPRIAGPIDPRRRRERSIESARASSRSCCSSRRRLHRADLSARQDRRRMGHPAAPLCGRERRAGRASSSASSAGDRRANRRSTPRVLRYAADRRPADLRHSFRHARRRHPASRLGHSGDPAVARADPDARHRPTRSAWSGRTRCAPLGLAAGLAGALIILVSRNAGALDVDAPVRLVPRGAADARGARRRQRLPHARAGRRGTGRCRSRR